MPELPLAVREITIAADPILDQVHALYEACFPLNERVPVRDLVEQLGPAPPAAYARHLLVSEAGGRLAGFASVLYLREVRCGFVMYVAVHPDFRNVGLGSRILAAAIESCRADAAHEGAHLKGVLMEVERVEDSANLRERASREARLRFFARHGAKILSDTYLQPPAWVGGPEVALNLLYLPGAERWPDRQIIPEFYRAAFSYGSDQPAVLAALQGYRIRE
jgi:GNAT superfamily N-acetyltransferase